jgi:hypothetical protein
MRWLMRPFLVLLAIVFLVEAWLWRHLEPVVATIVARIPLRALKARCFRSSSSRSGSWPRSN